MSFTVIVAINHDAKIAVAAFSGTSLMQRGRFRFHCCSFHSLQTSTSTLSHKL